MAHPQEDDKADLPLQDLDSFVEVFS